MALTKVSTDGVKDDAITKSKIPANQIEASELADNAVDTNAIADQAVALSKLPHGTSSNDGKFLRANNGADPTFETVTSTTINNNADNRVITGSGTANTLNAESGVVIDANGKLSVGASGIYNVNVRGSGQQSVLIGSTDAGGAFLTLDGDSNGDGSGGDYCSIGQDTNGNLNISADNPNGNAGIIFKSGNASEVARFDSGGLLGIGVTNPSSYDSYANQLVVSGSGHAGMTIRGNYANTGNIYFADGTSGGEKYDGYVSYSYPTQRLALGAGGTTRVRVTTDGLTFGGDTAAANALDDYEEGSWTPTMTNTGSLSNGVASGRYTKIGRMVHFVAYLQWSARSNDGGYNIKFGGLPFTCASYFQFPIYVGGNEGFADNYSDRHHIGGAVLANTTEGQFRISSSDGDSEISFNGGYGATNAGYIYWGGTYYVN